MKIEYNKYTDGLVPVVVQDFVTNSVLMVGFMNEEALEATRSLERVTFYSRSKKRLWTKGEESGHYLELKSILVDCDNDTLLVKAIPHGPVCHTGSDTCFNEINKPGNFLKELEKVIEHRKLQPEAGSYTSGLFQKGINAIAQKVGEEAVELVIEAKDNDDRKFVNEAADLLFHYLVLLRQKNHSLNDITEVLRQRHK